MKRVIDTNDVVASREDKLAKHNLVETSRFFSDIYVVAPGQAQKVHKHEGEDKCYYVLSGQGTVQSGEEDYDVGPGTFVFCPAGEDHGVKNDVKAQHDLRLLVFMAPHPRANQFE